MMNKEFAEFLKKTKGISYGDFTLKSGLRSTVFADFGIIGSAYYWSKIGDFFADYIMDNGLDTFDTIFGPAYKGIMIALATSLSLYYKYDKYVNVSFNRKEEKDHGEKGIFLGYDLNEASNIIIVDDVFTTGKTKYETLDLLYNFSNMSINYILVGVDRHEPGSIEEFEKNTGIKIYSISKLDDLS